MESKSNMKQEDIPLLFATASMTPESLPLHTTNHDHISNQVYVTLSPLDLIITDYTFKLL